MAASFKMAKSSFLNPMPSISSALSRTRQRTNYSISGLDDCHLFEATDHVLGDSEFFKCIQHGLLSITVRPIASGNASQSGKRHSLERIELTAAD